MKINIKLITMCMLFLGLIACSGSDNEDVPSEKYLYTSTNDTSGNVIIKLDISDNGGVTQSTTYTTEGFGDAADGDFDGQNSLIVVGNYLLAVNAGTQTGSNNGSISVFRIDSTTGNLTKVPQIGSTNGNIDSGGERPVSLSYYNGWVLVANQHSNPHYDGLATDRSTVIDSLGASAIIASSDSRNLVVFQFSNGALSNPIQVATYTSGNWGGPSQASFSPDGTQVAVSTWGVAQFGNGDANAAVQRPSRIYFYDVTFGASAITLTSSGIFQKEGLSGSIGLSWGKYSDRVFVANFNLAATDTSGNSDNVVPNYGATVISANGATSTNVFNSVLSNASPDNNLTNEVCWTWLSDDNTRLYTSNFGSNILSYFSVASDANSSLTSKADYPRQGINGSPLPAGDNKDIFITNNGKLYLSGAFQTHSIAIYDALSDGFFNERNSSPYRVPFSLDNLGTTVSAETHAYLGLVGYPKY